MLSAQAMNMNCFLLLLLYHRGSTLNRSHYSMCEQKYAIWFANSTRFIDETRVPTKPCLRSESCFLIGQNPNPTDRTFAPLDAPRSYGDPHPFRQHMQFRL